MKIYRFHTRWAMAAIAIASCQRTTEPTRRTGGSEAPKTAHPSPTSGTWADGSTDAGSDHRLDPSPSPPAPKTSQGHAELSESARSRVLSMRADELELHGFDGKHLVDFLSKLRDAIRRDDRQTVAGFVKYPLHVSVAGPSRTLRNSEELLNAYEVVMTARVKQEIENASICNVAAVRQAVGIGGDVLWIKDLNGLGIVTINVPGPGAHAFFPGGCQGDAVIEGVGCIPECQTPSAPLPASSDGR